MIAYRTSAHRLPLKFQRKWIWPISSPATMILPFAQAQQNTRESQMKVATVAPVSRSHTLSVLSAGRGDGAPPVRRHRHAIDTDGVAGERAHFGAGLQIPYLERLVPGSGDGAPPVRLTATPLTASEWPASVRSSAPVSRSHTLSVLSPDAETARRPSGVTATPLTESEWPASVRSSVPRLQIPHLERLVARTRRRPAARPASPPRH